MEKRKIRIGITPGDMNGVGYEVLLKAFDNPMMLELCTPVVFGSPKVATFYKKTMNIGTAFTVVGDASQAADGVVSMVACGNDDAKVEFGKVDADAGRAAWSAVQAAVDSCLQGQVDALVTGPLCGRALEMAEAGCPGTARFLERALSQEEGRTAMTVYVDNGLRVALATPCDMAVKDAAASLSKELVAERIAAFNSSLKTDFGMDAPRIAVLALNPQGGADGAESREEQLAIKPAIDQMVAKGVVCYGPYSADYLLENGNYACFDGILAMYHDQGACLFRALSGNEGVNYTAALPMVCAAPTHGVQYECAGQGVANEASMRQAVYLALDVTRNRLAEKEIAANPLRKQYHERRDDSDKLRHLSAPDDGGLL